MKKPMWIMLILMGALFFNMGLYHVVKNYLQEDELQAQAAQPIIVSTTTVQYAEWQPIINAVPELVAANSVDITTELEGLIQQILITSGQQVKAGDMLLKIKADDDEAELKALEANAELARITYERNKEQYAINVISEEALEADKYNLETQQALALQQKIIVEKKTIRAPFEGRLGLMLLSIGQYLQAGDFIISLQQINPLYAYFYTPEKNVLNLKPGQEVILTSDIYPDKTFTGKINALDAKVNNDTHNIRVEAIIQNPDEKLLPGMFANLAVKIGKPERYLAIPQTAVSYNPYGNLVYVVKEKPELHVEQQFVTLGDIREDKVVVLHGLKEGEQIVISGQIKLKNKDRIVINNEAAVHNMVQ